MIRLTPPRRDREVTFALPLARCPQVQRGSAIFNEWRPGTHELPAGPTAPDRPR